MAFLLVFQGTTFGFAQEELPPTVPDTAQDIIDDVSFPTTSSEEREILDERTKFSKRYRTKEGTYREEVYQEPIHYQDNGKWKNIDKTLVDQGDEIENGDNQFQFQLKKKLSKGYQKIGKGQEQKRCRAFCSEVRGQRLDFETIGEIANCLD